ncbi:K02A2.6-like [Cordylochernes scorpioides]|uniref:K02A2.6-like n=1 Tax=Cordylochernes scorpioides TaxID=51811 RepID=A0ABY6L9I8_9ARAC|nr:K02A2.6-like [Cordylochernes scorpioides]
MPGHRKRRQFKRTDAFTRGMVIGLKRAGWSIRQIAADTHLGASTVHRLWRRWLEQGNVAIYRNAGATRVTSARVDRRILRQAVAAPQATCTAILQHVQDTLDHSISTRTISRRLVANGLHSCRPLRRLPLTPPNRRQRLEWCRARSTWMTEWHRVVFSDESRFCLSSDSRRVRVWRRHGERPNPAAILERPTVRQRGIMVWGAIAYDSRTPLLRIQGTMTAQRYFDDVLRPVTLPYLQGVHNALYQQDNARPHTARISQQALQDVQMLPWPPYSPDLSPIEHVWDIIGRRLHALPQPRSEDELWQMVEREWRAIPQDAIRTLIDSLPRRVAACIAVRDGAKNLDNVIEAFDNHFIGKRNVVYERALFGLRSQRPEETIEEFLTVLHRISEHCEYANLREELIRDRLVLGVKDRKLLEKLMLNENLTLAKAVEIARQWEAVMREQQDLNPSTSQVDTTRKVVKQKPKASGHGKDNGRSTSRQIYRAKETDEKKNPTCFNCKTTNHHYHFRDKCPAKDKVCEKCAKKGHYTNLCRRKIMSPSPYQSQDECRRVPLPLMPKLKEQLDAMVAQEVIEPVDDLMEWCAPIVLAGKPNGKIRICVDLSRLNLSVELLGRLKNSGITLNKEKCQFGVSNVTFLGHYINEHGIKADEKKVKAFAEMKPQTDVQGVQRFMGMVNFLGRIVPNLAETTKPLNDLRKKNVSSRCHHREKHARKSERSNAKASTVPYSVLVSYLSYTGERPNHTLMPYQDNHFQHRPASIHDRLAKIALNQKLEPTLQNVAFYSKNGWPAKCHLSPLERSFYDVRDEIGEEHGLLMRGLRVIIPSNTRKDVLNRIHAARTTHLQRLSGTTVAKSRVDLFHYERSEYLVVVDYFSRFIEVVRLTKLSSEAVVDHCKAIFARHGIPDIVISDNGPQFRPSTTSAFTKFASEVGFRHITSSPKHPQSYGQAEAAVKIVKNLMKKNKDPVLALMEYRATPLANGLSPAELLFGRKILTMGGRGAAEDGAKTAFDRRHAAMKKAEQIAGEKVWVKDLRAWGSVVKKSSAPAYTSRKLLELPAETEETPGNELPAEELQQQTAVAPEMKQPSSSPGKVSRFRLDPGHFTTDFEIGHLEICIELSEPPAPWKPIDKALVSSPAIKNFQLHDQRKCLFLNLST